MCKLIPSVILPKSLKHFFFVDNALLRTNPPDNTAKPGHCRVSGGAEAVQQWRKLPSTCVQPAISLRPAATAGALSGTHHHGFDQALGRGT